MAVSWLEDHYTPRVDMLAKPLRWWSRRLPVEHPEYFRQGDIVRVATSGEAIYLVDAPLELRMRRAIGARKRRSAPAGTDVVIIGNVSVGVPLRTYRRWWWRPWTARLGRRS